MVEDGSTKEFVDKSLELSYDSINFLNVKGRKEG